MLRAYDTTNLSLCMIQGQTDVSSDLQSPIRFQQPRRIAGVLSDR